jgi:4-amino-4-deoxy-L-arabinose transferase-like glycosyltransferase
VEIDLSVKITNLSTGRSERETDALTTQQILWAFAALFLLNLLLRVFYLRYDFVNGDEGVRALTATQMLDGARLYTDVVTDKPPGATFFYAVVFALFGRSMKAVHLAATIWNFATAIIIYRAAALVLSKRAGWWAALLFIYFSTNYLTQDMMAANTELLMALPYTAAFYFYLRAARTDDAGEALPRGHATWLLIAAGLMTGLATMFKQVGVLNLLFFGLYELAQVFRARRFSTQLGAWIKASVARLSARLSLIALGFALVIAAFIVWLALTGALRSFWRDGIEINMFYVDSEQPNLWLRFLVRRGLGYVLLNASLWALAGWAVAGALKNGERKTEQDSQSASQNISRPSVRFNLATALWGGMSLIGVWMSGRFFGHYFITVLPALALLAASRVEWLAQALRDPSRRRRAQIILTALAMFFIVGLLRAHHRTAILAYETITGARTHWSEEWGMTERQHEADAIIEALRDKLTFGEPLYIWGYAHDIYWRTGCRPASRYLTPYYIDGRFPDTETEAAPPNAPFWQKARADLISDLRRTRPRLILDVYGSMDDLPYPEIVDFLKANYRDDGAIGPNPNRPFRVLRLKDECGRMRDEQER